MSRPVNLTSELPWLLPAQTRLRGALARDRLPTGLLIHGAVGLGANWFALWVSALALCEDAANAPCGRCRSCARVEAGRHPDYQWIAPLEESKEIRVDQIRELALDLALTSHAGGRKVVVLAPAERLNRNAANSLLKTLEEPSGRTVIVLVSAHPARLPATLRSRCQRIDLVPPTRDVAAAWVTSMGGTAESVRLLDLIGLEPIAALGADAAAAVAVADDTANELLGALRGSCDVVATAERWSRADYEWRLACVETWITDRVRGTTSSSPAVGNMRAAAHLPAGHSALNIRALFDLLDGARDLRRLADAPLNKSLALERLLWRVAAVGGRNLAGA